MTPQPTSTINRRQLLAGVGGLSIASFGLGRYGYPARVSGEPQRYSQYTYAASEADGPRLRVAWNSTYNGEASTASPVEVDSDADAVQYVGDDDQTSYGPLVAESNILPGDSGTIHIGLLAEEMDARIRLFVTDGSSDLVEAGDTSDTGSLGPLSEVIEVALLDDNGLFGIGGCTGTQEPAPDDWTSLAALYDRSESQGGLSIRGGFESCLAAGDRHCLTVRWKLPEAVTNEWQGAAADFGLVFAAEQCTTEALL